ncbi:hypothetical protein PRZ48_010450 [Zasmidium cellare]|uniref:Uncharacterized protein n=1 Tax=Zasmidium cellare TaxID=395010 RepID=A0ABR0E986_ZASCE|nr:hypothetical protein PRZ48_010450 [Zasmidium cellare]
MAAEPPSTWTQFFPPKAAFTDKDIPDDLAGKVYFVTGASSGIGAELTRVLYAKNAKVYLACRSEEKAKRAIENVQAAVPNSKGQLVFIPLDQADLNKTKAAAESFLAQESRLDVLFNNAGVMTGESKPPKKTVQGHELALGVNCVGAFLLTKLLTPLLQATAQKEQAGAVRVVWLSSYGLVAAAPNERGIDMSNLDYHIPKTGMDRYGISKAGDWLLAVEFARRYKADGIESVALNPGNLSTELARNQGCMIKLIASAVCYPPIHGAYTLLFAAFSPAISKADWTSEWVIPWGRLAPLRKDLPVAVKSKEDGGNGNAQEFWEWNEEQVKDYL